MAATSKAHAEGDHSPSDIGPVLIPAETSLQEQRPRALKHGDTFAVYDHNGDILAGAGSPEGLFHADTRHLSRLQLSINGARPMLLSSGLRDDNAALICDLSNPDLHDGAGNCILAHDRLHIRRVRLLWDAVAYERIAIKNFDSVPQNVTLTLSFAAGLRRYLRSARRHARTSRSLRGRASRC